MNAQNAFQSDGNNAQTKRSSVLYFYLGLFTLLSLNSTLSSVYLLPLNSRPSWFAKTRRWRNCWFKLAVDNITLSIKIFFLTFLQFLIKTFLYLLQNRKWLKLEIEVKTGFYTFGFLFNLFVDSFVLVWIIVFFSFCFRIRCKQHYTFSWKTFFDFFYDILIKTFLNFLHKIENGSSCKLNLKEGFKLSDFVFHICGSFVLAWIIVFLILVLIIPCDCRE